MHQPSKRLRIRLIAVAAAGAVIFAGCGGDDDDSGQNAAARAASEAAAEAPETSASPATEAPSEAAPAAEAAPTTPEAAAPAAAPTPAAPSSSGAPKSAAAAAKPQAGSAAKPQAATAASPAAGSAAGAPAPAKAGAPAPAGGAPAPAGQAPAGGPAAAGGATDVGVTANEIKFGGIYMFGWPLGDVIIQPMVREQRALSKIVNDSGGINGRKITYIDCDDGFPDPARTRACYKKLTEQDKIFAMMGGCSFNEDQFQADLQKDKMPNFSACSLYAVEWENPYTFPIHMDMRQEAHATSKWVLENKKPKTYGLLCLDIKDSQAACGIVEENMKKAGVQQVYKRTFRTGVADMSADILAARTANPDLIIHYTIDPSVTSRYLIDAAQQDYWPPMGITGNHMTTEIIGSLIGEYPAQAEGGYRTNTSYKLWGADYIAWQRKYVPNNKGLSLHISQGQWFGTSTVIECLRRVGPNLTRVALMDCMNSQRWETGPGLGQAFQWAPGQRYGDRTGNTLEYMYKYVSKESYAKDDGSGAPAGFIPDPEGFEMIAPTK